MIGGQAVIEGVMMKSATTMATCCRDEFGEIKTEVIRLAPPEKKHRFFAFPFVRGVVNLVSSLVLGTKTLMRSAEVYGETEKPNAFETWLSEKLKIDAMSVISFVSVLLGVVFAVGLFIFAPQYIRILIETIIGGGFTFNILERNLIEGGVKVLIFISYLLLVGLIKDVRRTFMYHGAEHKTISCYEKGLPLTPENAMKCSRLHSRCGTTFTFIVVIVSIIIFAVFEALLGNFGIKFDKIVRVLIKIAMLPFIAGVSYEILRLLAKTENKFFLIFKAPGFLLQKITTKEPTVDMLEVAISAFNKVLLYDEDKALKEEIFFKKEKCCDLASKVIKKFSENGIDESDAKWLVSINAGVSKSTVLSCEDFLNEATCKKIYADALSRINGTPLWYVLGDTEFYGYKIKVNKNVLIPRPETENLVEKALPFINKESKVLDLCTGSGAISVAVNKQKNCKVIGADISKKALNVAKENAKINGADVEFICSDMFSKINGKFDIIISNPPYIKESDLKSLQKEVKKEPKSALDGGKDGLKFYRIIKENYKNYLAEGGRLFLEFGYDQAKDIKNIFGENTIIHKDLEGLDRIAEIIN